MNKYVCVHGHFYQPPRENPWLEQIEQQDSAYPFHDWNDKITDECYEPNTASRILSEDNKIIEIVNNYSRISFNFGPTLLSWLATHNKEVYNAILDADKKSLDNFDGHGSAMAQGYNHMILPLANERDKRTQVLWGIRDFESRFNRKPEGMWLPETAVNTDTLEILVEYGIKFTILAPNQASQFKKIKEKDWIDLNGNDIDPRRPYLYYLPSGKSIVLFFYDGAVSNSLAFQGLLGSGKAFADRMLDVFDDNNGNDQLSHVATDGESYGHHHRHGDMALAFCLHYIEENKEANLTNYSAYMEKVKPEYEVKLHEDSSWSCAHGIERWRSNCGCKATDDPNITQEWRTPLREALDWLRDKLAGIFEHELDDFIVDPWLARNDYIKVILNRTDEQLNQFFTDHATRDLTPEEQVKVRKLMEMQRHAMLMYTSCGWFFNDISGIETVQIIQYAARAIQLGQDYTEEDLEKGFLAILEKAESNFPKFVNGKVIYEKFIKPGIVDLMRVGAHYAISSLFHEYPKNTSIDAYSADSLAFYKREAGEHKMGVGKTIIQSRITGEEKTMTYAVLHLGGHNVLGGIREFNEHESFVQMHEELKEAFIKSDIIQIIHLLDRHFGTHSYSFWHLFKDEQRNIIRQLVSEQLDSVRATFRQIFNNNYGLMKVLVDLDIPMPDALAVTGEFILNSDFNEHIEDDNLDIKELRRITMEMNNFSFNPDKKTLSFYLNKKIKSLMDEVYEHPEDVGRIRVLDKLFSVLRKLELDLDLWKSQNTYYRLWKNKTADIRKKAVAGDKDADRWLGHFYNLGRYMNVKVEEDKI